MKVNMKVICYTVFILITVSFLFLFSFDSVVFFFVGALFCNIISDIISYIISDDTDESSNIIDNSVEKTQLKPVFMIIKNILNVFYQISYVIASVGIIVFDYALILYYIQGKCDNTFAEYVVYFIFGVFTSVACILNTQNIKYIIKWFENKKFKKFLV